MESEPQTPVANMSLIEAKRSWLMSLEGVERYQQQVFGADPASMPDEEVERLYAEGQVRWENIQMLEAHIAGLEYRKLEEEAKNQLDELPQVDVE